MSDNFQDSTLTTFKIQQLSTFDNFQYSTTSIFDNLVSNMQFQFSVLELATYRNLEVENFRLLTLKIFTFALWSFKFEVSHFRSFKFEVWRLKFEFWRLKFEDFHFRTLKFEGLRYLTFKVIFSSFRSLGLSRRRPSLRVAGQATDISPLAVAFILADGAQQRR